jgi:Beta protein
MFKHDHYVPVLKGKRAEFPSLEHMSSLDDFTPLFEAVPGSAAHTVPRRMSAFWEANRPYFIDAVFLDDEDSPEGEAANHPLAACFAEVAAQGQLAVPVTGTDRSPAYQAALRRVVREQGHGMAIRLTPEDFEDEDMLPDAIAALVRYARVQREEVDLMIDAKTVAHLTSSAAIRRMLRGMIDAVPDLSDWRTLTVIAGAFPTGLGPLQRGWNLAPRLDWQGWLSLIGRPISRRPSYGDYTIAHPDLPPSGRATILAQIRYTTPESFLIYKGRNVFTHADGYGQFRTICSELIDRDEYRGADFSWGDSEIQERAAIDGATGNAETWRTIGTNHHIETVIDQIANLPEP